MNNEQLQDWLTKLHALWKEYGKDNVEGKRAVKEVHRERNLLTAESDRCNFLINYLSCSYTDVDLIMPLFEQLLSCYYKRGVLRLFVLQFIPSLIYLYLLALAKRQRKSISMFETLLLAVYNEEVLECGTGSTSTAKKVEEVRIPSVRLPSVYHNPKLLNLDVNPLNAGPVPPVHVLPERIMTVRIGPYGSYDRITAENRQLLLTRILKSVNLCLHRLSREVVCRQLCLSTIALCQSGFSFRESDLCSRVFNKNYKSEVIEDFSKKPRLRISSQFLLESLNGVYFALFNGCAELAVQAVDAAHHRAQYEFYADVILVTNSIKDMLLESNFQKGEDYLHVNRNPSRVDIRRHSAVTNASLQLKRMPEDIALVTDVEVKNAHVGSGVENLKKGIALKLKQHGLHRSHRRRKSESCVENIGDADFDTIVEEAQVTDDVADHLAEVSVQYQQLDGEPTRRRSLSDVSAGNVSAPDVLQLQKQNGLTSKKNEASDSGVLGDQITEMSIKNDLKGASGDGISRLRHMDSVVETPF